MIIPLALTLLMATSQAEEKDLEELLSIVQQETDVATKTRMNSDYVPGIVTVLEGDELEALGIANAGEALGLVPGMQTARDDRGSPTVIVRGLDFPFNSGNIRILINGVPMSRADAGINTSALLIPIEQIERIEVIRGPGSVVYGDFAFMGLVNIITRKEGTRVFGRVETPHPSLEAGARVAVKGFSANVSRWTSDNAAAPSQFHDANDHRWFGVAAVDRGGFSLTAQATRRTFGPAGTTTFDEKTWAVDGRYARDVTPTLHAEGRVSYLHNDAYDFISKFTGNVTKVGADVVWTGMRRNSWLAGADYTSSTIDDALHRLPPGPGQPQNPLTPVVSNVDRNVTGVTLQDRIDLRDKLTLTLGARYDSYSDLSSRVTPRVALVWRVRDKHILKAQYAEGFRPPTFFELYQPPAPGSHPRYPFEVNATTEINYVYREAGRVGRVTLFHSVISNMIRPGGVVIDPNATANGLEMEWSQQVNAALKFDANASYAGTVDPRVPGVGKHPNSISPEWLANVGILYHPIHSLLLGARWNHIDERPTQPGYDLVDLTISRADLFVRGLDLRAGIKNAMNSDVRYLQSRPNGDVAVSLYPGRSVWVQVSWKR